jgi:hypothetical protein
MDHSIDPFASQALRSERRAFGVAACTDHSDELHGRVNHNTAGVPTIGRKLMMVVPTLERKLIIFREKWRCSAWRAVRRRREQAMKKRAASVSGIVSAARGFKFPIVSVGLRLSYPSLRRLT